MGLDCQPSRYRVAWKRKGGEGWTQKEHLMESAARIWARDGNAALGGRARDAESGQLRAGPGAAAEEAGLAGRPPRPGGQ